jgi:His/Glu/Gln/Arg/opine family amino acid ABC transporter permease subunit
MTISDMSFLQRMVYIVQTYSGSLLKGTGVTMSIAIICTALGCLIGFGVGIVQTIELKKSSSPISRLLITGVKVLLSIYVEFFRGTPMMLQAAFIFYGASQLFGINMGMWSAAILIVSINTGAYMAETVRGGILSVDIGQTEGAKAVGMNHFQTMTSIILPQALRLIMPQIGNNLIINIKDTCVLSIIGTVELFFTFKSISGALYTYFEAATVTLIIYFFLTFTCSKIMRYIERRMDGPENFDLATTDTLAYTSGMNLAHGSTRGRL